MRQTTLPEERLTETSSALARLEEMSLTNAQPDVFVQKWSKRSRYAFLLFAGLASWTAIIAFVVSLI